LTVTASTLVPQIFQMPKKQRALVTPENKILSMEYRKCIKSAEYL